MQTIFPIIKPKGPTSHDIVDKVRRITGIRKVGHAGTLDPLASGVLVIGVTRAGTKQMSELVKTGKEYLAKIRLGETSTTDDEEGQKTLSFETSQTKPDLPGIQKVLPQYLGKIQQIPPIYSAVKIKGKSAYKYARKGEDLKLESREVEIKEIEIVAYKWPYLQLRVETGSGVYIRSLARDIGEALGTGAYLAELQRTKVGHYLLADSQTLEEFEELWNNQLRKEFESLSKS